MFMGTCGDVRIKDTIQRIGAVVQPAPAPTVEAADESTGAQGGQETPRVRRPAFEEASQVSQGRGRALSRRRATGSNHSPGNENAVQQGNRVNFASRIESVRIIPPRRVRPVNPERSSIILRLNTLMDVERRTRREYCSVLSRGKKIYTKLVKLKIIPFCSYFRLYLCDFIKRDFEVNKFH